MLLIFVEIRLWHLKIHAIQRDYVQNKLQVRILTFIYFIKIVLPLLAHHFTSLTTHLCLFAPLRSLWRFYTAFPVDVCNRTITSADIQSSRPLQLDLVSLVLPSWDLCNLLGSSSRRRNLFFLTEIRWKDYQKVQIWSVHTTW